MASRLLSDNPALRSVLDRLHAQSLAQDDGASLKPGEQRIAANYVDKLVALEEDKCEILYLLLRATGATRVVEAGTSYGVSLLWILAAVIANEKAQGNRGSHPTLVIGTEHEPKKVEFASSHIREAFGGSLPSQLSLLEGDLLQTLPAANIPDRSIDFLLLDIWAPMALPTLKIVAPKLRTGALVIIDNTTAHVFHDLYKPLLTFLKDPANNFQSTTAPYSGGLEIAVYVGPN